MVWDERVSVGNIRATILQREIFILFSYSPLLTIISPANKSISSIQKTARINLRFDI